MKTSKLHYLSRPLWDRSGLPATSICKYFAACDFLLQVGGVMTITEYWHVDVRQGMLSFCTNKLMKGENFVVGATEPFNHSHTQDP